MTNTKEVSRKELKENLIIEIKNAGSYEEAYDIKEAMERGGFSLSLKIYIELVMRCHDLPTALVLKKEMEDHNISIPEEIYIMIMKKANSFQTRLELLEEMEMKETPPTIKTYYTLIKIEENLNKATLIFNRMKANHIEPDGRMYELLHRKFLGHREYTNLKEEIKIYESIKLCVLKFLSYENVEDGIKFLFEEDQITNPSTIGKLLYRIKDISIRIKLLCKSMEAGLELDHIIYWNFLLQAAQEGLAEENKTFLKSICYSLSTAEKQKLYEKFTATFGKSGGKVKFQIQLAAEEAAIREKAICAADKESFFYYHGKTVGLTLLDTEIEEELEYLEELKTWEDPELFEYEVIKSEGILKGIELQQKIQSYWSDQNLPVFVIIYMEDTEALSELYNYAITQGLYSYELDDINRLNISGCFFTDSVALLQKAIETIDFDYFDVVINIFFQDGNIQFYESHPSSENWLQNDFPKTKALMPRFLTLKEGYSKNISSLFSSLYTPVTFKRRRSKL